MEKYRGDFSPLKQHPQFKKEYSKSPTKTKVSNSGIVVTPENPSKISQTSSKKQEKTSNKKS